MNEDTLFSRRAILIAGVLGLARQAAFAVPPTQTGTPDAADAQVAVEASNDFGLALFDGLVQSAETKNVFMSPTSISMALAMTCNGAGGATRTAMAKTLSLPDGAALSAVNASHAALLHSLTTGNDGGSSDASGVTLSIANAIWGDKSVHFAPDFVQRCEASYGAAVRAIHFSPASAAIATINSWVSDNTRGKITQLIPPNMPFSNTDAVLTDAIYFKGTWTTAFHKEATRDAIFHRVAAAGGDKTVPMMQAMLPAGLLHADYFDAVRLPYGNGRFAFYAFLPATDWTTTALATALTPARWQEYRAQLSAPNSRPVQVEMPRFKIAFETSLKKPLIKMGMGIAFSGKADFRPMGLPHDFIGEVLHKAVLEVNEEGSEAAAATGVIMSRGAAMVRPRRIVLDRPFLCAIVDDQTRAVLFAGVVNDPE